jgi:hypothetical protein
LSQKSASNRSAGERNYHVERAINEKGADNSSNSERHSEDSDPDNIAETN